MVVKPARAAAPAAETGRPPGRKKRAKPDELKLISGVGPKNEGMLNELGIYTYAQVAALAQAEIAWLDDHLGFSGRIGRDDWIGQAKRLSGAQ